VRALAPGGLLAVHITNRHLDLAPMLAAQVDELGLSGLRRRHSGLDELTATSDWVVLARRSEDLAALRTEAGWEELPPADGVRAWTDDYSSLVEVLDVGWPESGG
jgi:hypothetical protein